MLPTLLLLIASPWLSPNNALVFAWTPLFVMGLVAFLYREKSIALPVVIFVLTVAFFTQWEARSLNASTVGLAFTAIIILRPDLRCPPLERLGVISYSLYLLHIPVGGAVDFHLRFLPEGLFFHILALTASVGVSIVAAHYFYKWIEHPMHRYARSLGRKKFEG